MEISLLLQLCPQSRRDSTLSPSAPHLNRYLFLQNCTHLHKTQWTILHINLSKSGVDQQWITVEYVYVLILNGRE